MAPRQRPPETQAPNIAFAGRDIVFFDGDCGLCDAFVQYVLRKDAQHVFWFSPLQGDLAAREMTGLDLSPSSLRTVYVRTCDGRWLSRSAAVLYVLDRLSTLWFVRALGRVVPSIGADFAYDLVARNRHRIFSRPQTCRLPTPGEKTRFIG